MAGRLSDRQLGTAQSGRAEALPSWGVASTPFWIVVAITAVAAVVRASGLSGDFYADEVWIVDSARSSYHAFLKEVMADWVHPPLFFFLMYGLDAIFGIDDLSGRMVAVVSGVISVPVIFWVGRMVHSERAGIVAAIILALSPIHIWHSQYGRHYSLLVLLVLLSTATFLRVCREPKNLLWSALYVLSTVALVYTHYFGWIVVMCQSTTFLVFRFITLKHWFVFQLVLVLTYVPWLLAVIPVASAGRTQEKLIPHIGWMGATTFWHPVRTIIEFNGPMPATAGKVASLVLLTGIGALAFLPLLKRAADWRLILFLFISVAGPFFLVFGISRTVQPIWLHRVMMISLPAYYLIIGIGTQALTRQILNDIVSIVAVSWVTIAFVVYLYHSHRMPYEEMAYFLENVGGVETTVLTQDYYLDNPLRQYYNKPNKIYLLSDNHISVAPESQLITRPGSLKRALEAADTVIVVSRYPLEEPVQSYLDANYRSARKRIFVGKGEDWLYQQRVVSVSVYQRLAESTCRQALQGRAAAVPRFVDHEVGMELRPK